MKTIEQCEIERELLVEESVTELLCDEYNPLTKENFGEFMQNMNDSELEGLLEWMREYNKHPKTFTLECLGRSLYIASRKYWIDAAIQKAEMIIPPAQALYYKYIKG